jgi:hypothetical protein
MIRFARAGRRPLHSVTVWNAHPARLSLAGAGSEMNREDEDPCLSFEAAMKSAVRRRKEEHARQNLLRRRDIESVLHSTEAGRTHEAKVRRRAADMIRLRRETPKRRRVREELERLGFYPDCRGHKLAELAVKAWPNCRNDFSNKPALAKMIGRVLSGK